MRKIIGLTGGVAAGKSTVSKFLGELGANIINVDQIGHRLYQIEEVKQVVFETFPTAEEDGRISRRKLGEIVFQNEDELAKLNNIMIPRMFEEIRRSYIAGINIVDMAILFESGFDQYCDTVVTVVTPLDVRLRRMRERGYSPEKIKGIMESQMTQEEKVSKSDHIINNYDEPKQLLQKRVEIMYNYLLEN